MSNNSSNHLVVPAAREAMEKFKMEAANEVGVNLKNGYNGDLTSRQASLFLSLFQITSGRSHMPGSSS